MQVGCTCWCQGNVGGTRAGCSSLLHPSVQGKMLRGKGLGGKEEMFLQGRSCLKSQEHFTPRYGAWAALASPSQAAAAAKPKHPHHCPRSRAAEA